MEQTKTQILETPFTEIHKSLGAKMAPFAGYLMPITYDGVVAEHINVRENVGVFDVSHMGEFIVKGEHALDLIQWVTSNDASVLTDGKVQYSCFPNEKGGIVDDLLVYRIDAQTYMLVVNASNIQKDYNWIASQNKWNVDVKDISERTALLAVQGPNAAKALQSLTDVKLDDLVYYTFKKGTFAGIENVLISATGYTGAGGFEIYFDKEHATHIWNAIFTAGHHFNIKPAGLAARDTLRLEMGFCLYGNDIDDTTSPIEAGLGWITKFNKDFVGKAIFENQKQNGVTKKLIGFELVDRGVPRQGYEVCDSNGNTIGKVTSGTKTPSLQSPVGLAYVASAFSKVDSEIFIRVREQLLKAKVVKLPFFKK
jgi:aminomethyltransferase